MNTIEPKPNEPGLNRLDCEHLERLLKAGHLATAVKLYRSACRCSAAQAKLEIEALAKIPVGNGSSDRAGQAVKFII